MGIALRPQPLSVERFVDAPAEVVWRLLIDVQAWPAWGPSVRRAVLEDGGTLIGAGTRGTVWTVAGVRVPFHITEFSTEFAPARRWSWTVAGVTATGHTLTPADGGCRVRFTVPWWAPAYLPVCAVGVDRLAALAQAAP